MVRRGRGHSDAQGADYSLHTEIGDLRAWIDHLEQPVHLVGWSHGEGRSHSKMPPRTRVGSVVTYDPVLPPFAKGAVSMLEEADLNERVVVINRDISGLEPEIVEAMKDQSEWSHLRKLAIPLAAELAALNNFTPSKKWESVAAALIVGERSHAVEPYGPVFDRVSERIPQASVTVLPGQGHLAHVEDPTLLGTAIGTILTKGVST
ncbi:alpha/beta fold hydrolase [Brevibacterium epidermidis]|uniref:alpha/beta fold hydrolase n=2 Tax=Brevibacterium epidermidis TaxID=1698 RepID=UPI002454AF3E|nr:alpha/beta hydrolase [Brevibacterium epidermidis]